MIRSTLLLLTFMSCFLASLDAAKLSLFIGTSGANADGIYHTFFHTELKKFTKPTRIAEINSPNFLTLHPNLNCLYAVCRWDKTAGVIGYYISDSQELTEFTRMECPDGMGCHLTVHPTGRFLLTAQYGAGSIALYPMDQSGNLKKPQIIQHEGGSKVFQNRQDRPHPHWTGFSPCGNYALIPDLGLDQIVIYKLVPEEMKLIRHGIAQAKAGSGPRHMRFSKDGKYIYLLNELDLTVSTFSWNPTSGEANPISTIQALSETQKENESFNSAAEILVHPIGPYVYSSNRGHDSVTVYQIKEAGMLELIQVQPIRGAFPRNINLDPAGNWLFACGQHSGTIGAHQINRNTGRLTYAKGAITRVPDPICIVFSPR